MGSLSGVLGLDLVQMVVQGKTNGTHVGKPTKIDLSRLKPHTTQTHDAFVFQI